MPPRAVLPIAALVIGLLVSQAAFAVSLPPGGSAIISGATLADRPELAGTQVYSDGQTVHIGHPFWPEAIGAGWSVDARVLDLDDGSGLSFVTTVTWAYNTALSPFLIDALWLDGYGSFGTDVVYRTDDAGDRGPTFGERSAEGDRLTLTFGLPVFSGNLTGQPHQSAYPLQVSTPATAFDLTGVLTIVGRYTDQPGQTFYGRVVGLPAPALATPVPEPGTWVLMALGLLGVAGVYRASGVSGVSGRCVGRSVRVEGHQKLQRRRWRQRRRQRPRREEG